MITLPRTVRSMKKNEYCFFYFEKLLPRTINSFVRELSGAFTREGTGPFVREVNDPFLL